MDDLPLATVLISEALLRAGVADNLTHDRLKQALREVLDENGTTIRLEPFPLLADVDRIALERGTQL